MSETYVPCPECAMTLLTEHYRDRYGRCQTCYERDRMTLDQRIGKALF